jgi:hypothetical protein
VDVNNTRRVVIPLAIAAWKAYYGHMITTVNLPDVIHTQLKVIADVEHRSMNATILVAVERYIEEFSHQARVRELSRDVAQRDAELLDRLAQ